MAPRHFLITFNTGRGETPAVEWPAGWPALNDAVRLGDRGYEIPTDISRLAEFEREFGPTLGDRTFRISGKTGGIFYRLPFPEEHLWRSTRKQDSLDAES